MAAVVILAILVWNHILALFPAEAFEALLTPKVHLGRFGVEHILAAAIGFYFGSRSSGQASSVTELRRRCVRD